MPWPTSPPPIAPIAPPMSAPSPARPCELEPINPPTTAPVPPPISAPLPALVSQPSRPAEITPMAHNFNELLNDFITTTPFAARPCARQTDYTPFVSSYV